MSVRRPLTPEELHRQLEFLAAWTLDGSSLLRTSVFPTFDALIEAVNEIAIVAEELDHHPDLDIRWRTLTVRLTTHSAGAITQLDIESAHRIDACIRAEGG